MIIVCEVHYLLLKLADYGCLGLYEKKLKRTPPQVFWKILSRFSEICFFFEKFMEHLIKDIVSQTSEFEVRMKWISNQGAFERSPLSKAAPKFEKYN